MEIRIWCMKCTRCPYCVPCTRTFDKDSERPSWPHALRKPRWIFWSTSLCPVSIYSLWTLNRPISWPKPDTFLVFASAATLLCAALFRLSSPSNICSCTPSHDRIRTICARCVASSFQSHHPSICVNWYCSQSAFDVLKNNRTVKRQKKTTAWIFHACALRMRTTHSHVGDVALRTRQQNECLWCARSEHQIRGHFDSMWNVRGLAAVTGADVIEIVANIVRVAENLV